MDKITTPSPSSVEMVRQIRHAVVDQASFVKYLISEEQAAALIDQCRTVPRKMLTELLDAGIADGLGQWHRKVDEILVDYGYTVEKE